jgi:hypothetical protein
LPSLNFDSALLIARPVTVCAAGERSAHRLGSITTPFVVARSFGGSKLSAVRWLSQRCRRCCCRCPRVPQAAPASPLLVRPRLQRLPGLARRCWSTSNRMAAADAGWLRIRATRRCPRYAVRSESLDLLRIVWWSARSAHFVSGGCVTLQFPGRAGVCVCGFQSADPRSATPEGAMSYRGRVEVAFAGVLPSSSLHTGACRFGSV